MPIKQERLIVLNYSTDSDTPNEIYFCVFWNVIIIIIVFLLTYVK